MKNSPRIKSDVQTESNQNSAPGAEQPGAAGALHGDSPELSLRLQGNSVDAEIEVGASNDGRYVPQWPRQHLHAERVPGNYLDRMFDRQRREREGQGRDGRQRVLFAD